MRRGRVSLCTGTCLRISGFFWLRGVCRSFYEYPLESNLSVANKAALRHTKRVEKDIGHTTAVSILVYDTSASVSCTAAFALIWLITRLVIVSCSIDRGAACTRAPELL